MSEKIPTMPIRLVAKKTGLTSDSALGSAKIPADHILNITLREVFSSSADTWFSITADVLGTINFIYVPSAGTNSAFGEVKKPVESIEVGSVSRYIRCRVMNPTAAGSYACNIVGFLV